MTPREWLVTVVLVLPLVGAGAAGVVSRGWLCRVMTGIAVLTALAALTLAAVALLEPTHRELGRWIVVDPAGGIIVGVIACVGVASALVSPQFLSMRRGSLFQAGRADRIYWATFFAFWAVLLAVPLAGNLGAAWLAIEATTAASAPLVGFSGRARALEAGWKYLILTSLGLGVALLGILMLESAAGGGGIEMLTWRTLPHLSLDSDVAVVAYVLLLAGLAAKIGWAPVHNWLPDAHSEAPAPVSALLSAALLPAVLLVAWRSQQALAPTIGVRTAGSVLVGFGLASLAVAVPFLWQSQAWKRLLAYSSLEHMGVIALGVGFGGTLALAGVAIHVVGHALAKALGFYAAIPLLAHEPRASGHGVGGIGTTEPALGVSLGVSLGALAGLPPSPLFVSEVLIVAGGFQVGRPWAAGAAAILLALGFLGLTHALIDTLIGKPRGRDRHPALGLRAVTTMTIVAVPLLLALTVAALWLPDSAIVQGLIRGLG
ncbi:proton-conducting transporter membrane subunit [Gaiella sp.]|uniref:proton-conducting transporter transmembrane domain-containing protein n=1 Tax=Gaiella sp. TaxID=2663207 RepID=UPI003983D8C6